MTLAPNLTEIVFALGARETSCSPSPTTPTSPPPRAPLPRVGGLDASAEHIVSLHPDLVLASRDGNARGVVQALEAAGIPVLTVSGESLDAVLEGIRVVGDRLGRPEEGRRLAASLAAPARSRAAPVAGARRPAAILLVWPDPPQAAGGGTFLADVLDEAGARNLLAGRRRLARRLGGVPRDRADRRSRPARLARRRGPSTSARGVPARSRAARPPAPGSIRLDEAALTRPGPRVFDALETLAREPPPGAARGAP